MAWIQSKPTTSTRAQERIYRARLGHTHPIGSTTRRLVRSREHSAQPPPPVLSLNAAETQAVADTDHTALRDLLVPAYDGVATSFAQLLFRVVRRCKRNWQVNGRVLHACKSLGMPEGKPMPAVMLAKRLRGLGLAWHSFTLEECQAFVERELNSGGDGQVTERDVFVFLQTAWGGQQETAAAFSSKAAKASRSSNSRPRTLDDFHRGLGQRRSRSRQVAKKQAGDSRERGVPRVWEDKLLQAALSARSRNINVLEALRVSLCNVVLTTDGKLGIEATCRFLQSIGVGFEPGAMLERPTTTDKSSLPRSDCSRPDEFTCDNCACTDKGGIRTSGRTSRHSQASPRLKESSSRDQASNSGRHVPKPLTGNVHAIPEHLSGKVHAPEHLRENVSGLEPSEKTTTTQEQRQAERRTQQQDNKHIKCASGEPASAPDPPEKNRGAVDSTAFVDGAPPSRQRQEYAGAADGSNNTTFVAPKGEVVCTKCGKSSADSLSRSAGSTAPLDNIGSVGNRPRSDDNTWQRLRRAAADLRRMEAEYAGLQRQMCVENAKTGSRTGHNSSSEDNLRGNHSDDGTGTHRHTTGGNPGVNAFYAGRGTPPHYARSGRQCEQYPLGNEGERCKQCPLGREGEQCKQCPLESEGGRGGGTAIGEFRRTRQGAATDGKVNQVRDQERWETLSTEVKGGAPTSAPALNTLQDPSSTTSENASVNRTHIPRALGEQSRPTSCWPRHGVDTRKCRALLLMAAQGKSNPDETRDVPSAHNGFAGIRSHHFGEVEVEERGRTTHRRQRSASDAVARSGCFFQATPGLHRFVAAAGGDRRRASSFPADRWGGSTGDRGARDSTPERRPVRPKAIKSPVYATCRSEDRNVWDSRSGRWGRPGQARRGHSVDKYHQPAVVALLY